MKKKKINLKCMAKNKIPIRKFTKIYKTKTI